MAKYLLTFHGGSMPETEEARGQVMAAWEGWFKELGPALKDPDLVVLPFIIDELVVIAPHEHPLARRRNLSLKDLKDEPFLMREEGSGTRYAVERAARKANVRLEVGMELGSNGAIKHAVESGLGLAHPLKRRTQVRFLLVRRRLASQ